MLSFSLPSAWYHRENDGEHVLSVSTHIRSSSIICPSKSQKSGNPIIELFLKMMGFPLCF